MQTNKWRQKLGEVVREFFLSPEMKHFYSLKVTLERAKIYILQLALYVCQRRHYWPQLAKICARELGFRPEQMPNFVAHSQADEKHSDMFLDVLERYVTPSQEQKVLNTAKESMEIHRAYFGEMATAMAYLSS